MTAGRVPASYFRVTVEQMTGPDEDAKVIRTHVFHRLAVTASEHRFDVDVELRPPPEIDSFSSRSWPPTGPPTLLMSVRAQMVPMAGGETSRTMTPGFTDG